MKTISIIRHAKTEPFEHYDNDFERPLTARGKKDATRTANRLGKLTPAVDWWMSSPALRASQTSTLLTEAIGYDDIIHWDEAIYMAMPETLLELIRQVPDEAEHIALVGHNPGMEMLVSGLCAGAPLRLTVRMATGMLAHIKLEIHSWQQIRWNCGELHLLLKPKLSRI